MNVLSTKQPEVDMKIVLYACNVFEKSLEHLREPYNIRIRASNCDVLIIMLGNMNRMLELNNNILIDAGTSKYQRLINVLKMYKKLGSKFCKALPGLHAMTGCDYNPTFFRKKRKSL